ncbi:MAG: hypothetical protein BWK80_07640 [Desulfobacteraceae bacterium IS3]|jgi:hypothetical protein|nr:MAG: hypothetical protein BWK80_07640 [Desulfobacteraceae bacterium IS3]HAO20981.1 hypothetical protein [Desulfobacteraceae bacterium]
MKRSLIALLIFMAMTAGCSRLSPEGVNLPVFDKIYYVVFEGKPELSKGTVYYGDALEIGKILSQQPGANNLYVAKISILNKYNDMMKDTAVFYAGDGKMMYDSVGEVGKPLTEGAKILGFTGKTGVLWFKTKSKVKSLSEAAVNKAQDLYNKAGK